MYLATALVATCPVQHRRCASTSRKHTPTWSRAQPNWPWTLPPLASDSVYWHTPPPSPGSRVSCQAPKLTHSPSRRTQIYSASLANTSHGCATLWHYCQWSVSHTGCRRWCTVRQLVYRHSERSWIYFPCIPVVLGLFCCNWLQCTHPNAFPHSYVRLLIPNPVFQSNALQV